MSLAMHLVYFASFLFLIHLPKDVYCDDKTTIGEDCATGDTCSTTPTSVCDATEHKCLLDVGQSCAAANADKCKTGTSCDTDDLCKLDVLQSCASPNAANCKTDLACDTTDNKCRYKATTVCTTGVDRCVSGATCASITAQCTCNTAVYTANAGTGLCEAITKKVGGSCTAGTGACEDPNASCNANSKCECNPGYQTKTADATCSVIPDTYGGACTNPTSGPDSCVAKDANAVCTGNKCACKPGYSATIGTKCSGVAGLTCSMFLLGIVLLVSKYFQ